MNDQDFAKLFEQAQQREAALLLRDLGITSDTRARGKKNFEKLDAEIKKTFHAMDFETFKAYKTYADRVVAAGKLA